MWAGIVLLALAPASCVSTVAEDLRKVPCQAGDDSCSHSFEPEELLDASFREFQACADRTRAIEQAQVFCVGPVTVNSDSANLRGLPATAMLAEALERAHVPVVEGVAVSTQAVPSDVGQVGPAIPTDVPGAFVTCTKAARYAILGYVNHEGRRTETELSGDGKYEQDLGKVVGFTGGARSSRDRLKVALRVVDRQTGEVVAGMRTASWSVVVSETEVAASLYGFWDHGGGELSGGITTTASLAQLVELMIAHNTVRLAQRVLHLPEHCATATAVNLDQMRSPDTSAKPRSTPPAPVGTSVIVPLTAASANLTLGRDGYPMCYAAAGDGRIMRVPVVGVIESSARRAFAGQPLSLSWEPARHWAQEIRCFSTSKSVYDELPPGIRGLSREPAMFSADRLQAIYARIDPSVEVLKHRLAKQGR